VGIFQILDGSCKYRERERNYIDMWVVDGIENHTRGSTGGRGESICRAPHTTFPVGESYPLLFMVR
jgi:hypothetical protein